MNMEVHYEDQGLIHSKLDISILRIHGRQCCNNISFPWEIDKEIN